MSEMIATANAKSIEDIKSFISRAKETYKVPYETHPADRLRQCVFGGSSNTMDFLPLDRSGNRRFLPIMVHPENAEIHILEDEAASRAFIDMMWAEVMFIYQNFPVKLTLSKDMDKELKELQKQFMPEDTKAGLIQSFLDNFKGTQVCSKLIYAEALNHPFDEPKQWEIREINEIMNNSIEGWRPFSNPRSFAKLPVHVRCLIDECANIGQIPNLEKLVATIRSREISACLVLQAKSQLKAIYKDNADTIIGNMDSQIFLGGSEPGTLKDLSELLGKETIDAFNTSDTRGNSPSYGTTFQKMGHELLSRDELAVLDGGKCILQLRGVRPFLSDKYDLTQHPNYKLTSDYDPKNTFDIEKYLNRKEKINPNDEFVVIDADSLPPA